jgi:UDP-N-acetylmuramoyl-tripeptide--D-alanyl-D-alanine ligase
MTTAIAVLACLAALAALLGRLHLLLHVLQQEHYENARLTRWVASDRARLGLVTAAAVVAAGAVVSVVQSAGDAAGLAVAVVALAGAAALCVRTWKRPQIKPLVFTARARRLLAVAVALNAVPLILVTIFVPAAIAALCAGVLGGVGYVAAPWTLGAANRLLAPLQRMETQRYVRAATDRLARVAPVVVGITGSYGKTTTKACVDAVLSTAGPSYPTPASFNSYLGVVRAINEGLSTEDEFFVVEMGAYRDGDVAELCDLVHPRIGVLTAIGPAHLERFGSLDVTERAKGELAEALPEDGLFVTRADDERTRRVAADRARSRVVLFSPQAHPDADVWAGDVRIADGRMEFRLCTRDANADDAPLVRARLLGEHNIANLLAAAAVGFDVGLTPPQIARALSQVRPPDHRLAPIVNSAAGVIVIDDSYNANPIGAAAALEVLRAHPAKRRILVTPGMVELGSEEDVANRELGVLAARACDYCILSGTRAQAIRDGLLSAGFPEQQIVMTVDGPSAHAKVAEMTQRGDVILFENDLPDVYA